MHIPILYLIASPIGNIRDISARALEILAQTPLIAAEDTRRARKLLSAYDIRGKKLISLREHNETRAARFLIQKMQEEGAAAYLSDAGAPGISDPGTKLANAARAAGIRVSPIPGPSAPMCLLSAAGSGGAVHFFGFAPRSPGARQKFFADLPALSGDIVLFESPARIADAVARLREVFGDNARAAIGREMTKEHEQIISASLAEIAQMISDETIPMRGEFTVLTESPGRAPLAAAGDALFNILARELPPRKAAKIAAQFSEESAATYYRRRLADSQ